MKKIIITILMVCMMLTLTTMTSSISVKQGSTIKTVDDEYQFENVHVWITGRARQIGHAPDGAWDPIDEELYMGSLDMISVSTCGTELENLSITIVDIDTGEILFNKNRFSGCVESGDVDGYFYWGLIDDGNNWEWPPIVYFYYDAYGPVNITITKSHSINPQIDMDAIQYQLI